MNYSLLLELATTLGHRLAMSGAETYRVEESITRVLNSYGLQAEAFAIPNCLTVSIVTLDGKPMTRMRRIGNHGNDLDSVERYSNLSRRICAAHPDPLIALEWLQETDKSRTSYSLFSTAAGYFLGSFGFCIIFGGRFVDALWAGICGLIVMASDLYMDHLSASPFFKTISGAFASAIVAYSVHALGWMYNADAAIIGTLMLLVPGLLFTNAMRDIIYGDTNSGTHRIVQVLMIAVAIALGVGGALGIITSICGEPVFSGLVNYGFIMMNVGAFIGCIGFCIIFNIHGPGILLCALGGVLAWSAYLLTANFTGDVILGNLAGGLTASVYAEIMARIRKYPAISYLVVSIFPLIPGAGVYYTMNFVVQKNMDMFVSKGFETISIAGSIALGIILVSTVFRLGAQRPGRQRK